MPNTFGGAARLLAKHIARGAPEGTGLHGGVIEEMVPEAAAPALRGLLNVGNKIRYGQSESERMDDINSLGVPGQADYSTSGPLNIYDPAKSERYGSAYKYGERWGNVPGAVAAARAMTAASRGLGSKLPGVAGLFGIGEERQDLTDAENAGLAKGAAEGTNRAVPGFAALLAKVRKSRRR